jgi:hypothetical protein
MTLPSRNTSQAPVPGATLHLGCYLVGEPVLGVRDTEPPAAWRRDLGPL